MSKERPWEAGPFEEWVIKELDYRKNNLSSGIQGNFTGQYSGPRKAWARVFSNGMVEYKDSANPNLISDNDNEWGMVFLSGDGFFERYGLNSKSPYGLSKQVYGYNNQLKPKYIDTSTRPNIPDPGIISIETEIQKSWFAKAKINWTVHSIEQLKSITPYFLTPLQTVIVEFGWNTFNQQSLINISNFDQILDIWDNHYRQYSDLVPKSNGNYEFLIGQIVNFEYTINDNIITGMTEVASRQLLYSGFKKDQQENITKGKKIDSNGNLSQQEPNFRTKYELLVDNFVNNLSPSDTQGNDSTTNDVIKEILSTNTGYEKKYGTKFENLQDHIFSGRDQKIVPYQASRDFDINNPKGPKFTWITMDLLVDILNGIKNHGDVKDYVEFFFDLNIDEITIGAHDNLISTKQTVLIPNPNAPKLNSRESGRLQKVALAEGKTRVQLSAAIGTGLIVAGAAAGTAAAALAAAPVIAAAAPIAVAVGLEAGVAATETATTLGVGASAVAADTAATVATEATLFTIERALPAAIATPIASVVPSVGDIYNSLGGSVPDVDETGKPNGYPVLDQNYDDHSPFTPFSYSEKVGPNLALHKTAMFRPAKGVQRQDLDYVLNIWGRSKPNNRGDTAIPAKKDLTFGGKRKNKDDLKRGYLKNIYVNLQFLKDVLKSPEYKNLKDIYERICKEINDASCNFWELNVVDAPILNGKSTLKIVDGKGPPNKDFNHKIYKFEYMTNNSIIKKLNFTTTLSNAQANQIIFKAGVYDYTSPNQILDYSNLTNLQDSKVKPEVIYKDRILKTKAGEGQSKTKLKSNINLDSANYYFKQILKDGSKYKEGFLQVTLFKEENTKTPPRGGGIGASGASYAGGTVNYSDYDIVDIVMPFEELVIYMLNDGDLKNNSNIYNAPLRNVEIELSLMGIAGIKTFEFFRVTNLPPPFNDDVVIFQVINVTHLISENSWETRIKAQLRPAYNLLGK